MPTPLDPVAFAEKVRRQRTIKKPTARSTTTSTLDSADEPTQPLAPGVVQLNEHPRRLGRTAPNATMGSMLGCVPSTTRGPTIPTVSISDRNVRVGQTARVTTQGTDLSAPQLPPTQMVLPSASSLVSSSCNIDHDNDLIKRMLVGYMNRRKEERLVSEMTTTPESPDIFMTSIMAVSKITGSIGQTAPVAKVDPPTSKIPQRHWILRETMYSKPESGKRETGAVFLDLKNHRRAVVFPSAQPSNRPEVYFLAQTLDLLLKEVGVSMGGLDSLVAQDACYRIAAEDGATTQDPELEGSTNRPPPAPKTACSDYYDRGMRVWEVLDAGLTEVARQVTPGCAERAVLIEALRSVATDLGTTALRVMQFCKEEACNQQAENAALEYETQVQDDQIRQRDAEIARLQSVVDTQNSELDELRVVNERFQAMRTQIQLSAALLVRNDRLRPLLEAMEDADAERQRALDRAMEADTRIGKEGESEADRERRRGLAEHELKLRDLYESCSIGNPQLALLASGVGGIDIAAVKQLVAELDTLEGRTGTKSDDKGSDNQKRRADGATSGKDEVDINACPELYQEAVRYLLTLDEAVEAIDTTCEPFYQKMVFRDPALNTALAAGRWRSVAKALGRHEMVLEQRERQWKSAMTSTTRTSPNAVGGGVVQRVLNSVPGYGGGGGTLEAERLKHVTGTEGGHLRGTSHDDGVLEKQLALAKIFRGATRNALLGVHGGDAEDGLSNVGGMAEDGRPTVDPHLAEVAASQPEVQEFLNPHIMLPPSFAVGSAGVAKLFKETRTVLVEIVQRLCALALSAQFKGLVSEKALLPPDAPNVPCDLCGRLDVADTINKHRNDAMVEFAGEAARIQRRLEDDVRDLEEEANDLRKKLGIALRHEKEVEHRAATVERENSELKKELRMMREIEGLREGQSAADLQGLVYQRETDADNRNALAFSPGAANKSASSGSVIQRLIKRENVDDESDNENISTPTRSHHGLPLVLELVINCTCCGGARGGGSSGNAHTGRVGSAEASDHSLQTGAGSWSDMRPTGRTPGGTPTTSAPPRAPDLTASVHSLLSAAIGGVVSPRHPVIAPKPPALPKTQTGSRPCTPTEIEPIPSQSLNPLASQVDGDAVVPRAIEELGLFNEADEKKLNKEDSAAIKKQWSDFGARFVQPYNANNGGSQIALGSSIYSPSGAGIGDGPLMERTREGQLFPRISNATLACMTNCSDARIENTLRILQANIDASVDHGQSGRPGLASVVQARRNRRMQLFGLSRLSLTKSLGWLLRILARFYYTKLTADLTAVQEHGPEARLVTASEHLSNTLRNMFGTKGLIDAHASDIVRCCCQYFRVDPRVANFVKFLSETIHDTKMLFFFTRLSRAVDCCTAGLSYQQGTAAGFCNDEDQAVLERVSLSRVRGVLRQTRLVRKPYAAALWDVICDLSTSETNSEFRAAQRRAGVVLIGTEQHPKEWSVDEVSRARMTVPKSVFLSVACHFEHALREEDGRTQSDLLATKSGKHTHHEAPSAPPKTLTLPDEQLLSAVSQESLLQRLQLAIDSGNLPLPKSR